MFKNTLKWQMRVEKRLKLAILRQILCRTHVALYIEGNSVAENYYILNQSSWYLPLHIRGLIPAVWSPFLLRKSRTVGDKLISEHQVEFDGSENPAHVLHVFFKFYRKSLVISLFKMIMAYPTHLPSRPLIQ